MKKAILFTGLALLLGAIWYLFIKSYDYTIRFEVNAIPGTINQTLKLWDQSLDTVHKIKQENDLYHLMQQVKFGDSTHVYNWNLKQLTDSTSKVVVRIKDKNHSLMNKIQVPFKENAFVKRSKKQFLILWKN